VPSELATFTLTLIFHSLLLVPLPPSYLGNIIQSVYTTIMSCEILSGVVCFLIGLLHNIIEGRPNVVIRGIESIPKTYGIDVEYVIVYKLLLVNYSFSVQ
jgi:hypothetical protein